MTFHNMVVTLAVFKSGMTTSSLGSVNQIACLE